MKTYILSALLITSIMNSHADDTKKHNMQTFHVTEQHEQFTIYGDSWPHNITTQTSINDAIDNKNFGETGIFSGEVTQVCQKKGCWMILTKEDQFARVDFKNHSFLIPKNSQGRAQVYGTIKRKSLTQEQVDHYQSEGASSLTTEVYEIAADSVKLYTPTVQ